jgi:peptide/nickel transport system ATP-binding protein
VSKLIEIYGLFAPRCRFAEAGCIERRPPNVQVGPDRIASCILAERVEVVAEP